MLSFPHIFGLILTTIVSFPHFHMVFESGKKTSVDLLKFTYFSMVFVDIYL